MRISDWSSDVCSSDLFNSMFDVGQIEVLRGPQGTLRGRASPSGSITVTTQKPDLYESGGYADLTRTNLDALNVNGAFNLPIIPEKLAIRIAGIDDRNEGDHVRSIHSSVEPSAATKAYRASLRFEPGSEEHTSELQSLMRISYAVFC